jgi:choline-glycine betaine transporter
LAESVRSTASGQRAGSLQENVTELWALVVAYAKQETLDPIKALGRFVAFGVAGAVCLSLGVVLLALGGLRAIQSETFPHLAGNLSWIPYLAIVAACAAVLVLAVSRIGRVPSRGEQ